MEAAFCESKGGIDGERGRLKVAPGRALRWRVTENSWQKRA